MATEQAKAVEAYIQGYPQAVQARLQQLRELIRAEAPEAEEMMSYGVPAFKVKGRALVNYGAAKNHIGFYPTPSGVEAVKDQLDGYTYAKGSIQFPNDRPLPVALIKRVVKFRVKEEAARAKARQKQAK